MIELVLETVTYPIYLGRIAVPHYVWHWLKSNKDKPNLGAKQTHFTRETMTLVSYNVA